jgi:MFS family permease
MVISMAWLGIGVGCPFLGWLSDRIKRRNILLLLTSTIGMVTTLLIIYVPVPLPVMYVCLFGLGVAAAGQTLSFAVIKDNTPVKYVGTAVGFNNMAVVVGGAFFQPLVGVLLSFFWDGVTVHHLPVYTVPMFQESLWVLPLCHIMAFILAKFFIKETYCRPVHQEGSAA